MDPHYIQDDFLKDNVIEYFIKFVNGTHSIARKKFHPFDSKYFFILYTDESTENGLQ